MSVPVFVETITTLLNHPDPQLRRRALALFNQKVEEQRSVMAEKNAGDEEVETSTMLFLKMVDHLTEILAQKSKGNTPSFVYFPFLFFFLFFSFLFFSFLSFLVFIYYIAGQSTAQLEEDAVNRQMALLSLEILCRSFGDTHPVPFVQVSLDAIIRSINHTDLTVVSSALVAFASHAKQLGMAHLFLSNSNN